MQPNSTGRRPSLSHVSNTTTLSGRKQSIGGPTPMLASSSSLPSDIVDNRRGSLRDLAMERAVTARATQALKERLQKYREELARVLRDHKVSEILPCISGPLIEIEGSSRPVDAFEKLLESNIEAAPVYTIVGSTTSPSTFSSFSSLSSSATASPSADSSLDLSVELATTNLSPGSSASFASALASRSLTPGSSPATPSATLVRSALMTSKSLSSTLSPVPKNKSGRDYSGFLDVRDLVSSMIFVAVQPINEDDLVYTSTGAEVPDVEAPAGLEELAHGRGAGISRFEEEHATTGSVGAAEAAAAAATAAAAAANDSRSMFDEEEEDEFGRNSLTALRSSFLGPLSESPLMEDDEEEPSSSTNTKTDSTPSSISTTSGSSSSSTGTTSTTESSESAAASRWSHVINQGLAKFESRHPGSAGSAGAQITVRYLSRRNPYRPVTPDATLFEAARLFSQGAHRVPVVDSEGRCMDIIGLSHIIKFLRAHIGDMNSAILATRACDVTIGTGSVKEVPEDFTALETFVRMDEEGVSGLAIVDEDRKFLNATSSRDLKRFALDKGRTPLNQPILDYLQQTRGIANIRPFKPAYMEPTDEELAERAERAAEEDGDNASFDDDFFEYEPRDYTGLLSGAVTVSQTVTIHDVIVALADAGVSRAFCLDEDDVPARVISISDILKFACGMTNF